MTVEYMVDKGGEIDPATFLRKTADDLESDSGLILSYTKDGQINTFVMNLSPPEITYIFELSKFNLLVDENG